MNQRRPSTNKAPSTTAEPISARHIQSRSSCDFIFSVFLIDTTPIPFDTCLPSPHCTHTICCLCALRSACQRQTTSVLESLPPVVYSGLLHLEFYLNLLPSTFSDKHSSLPSALTTPIYHTTTFTKFTAPTQFEQLMSLRHPARQTPLCQQAWR